VTTQIDTLKSKKHNIHLTGKLYTKSSRIETIEAVLIGRETSYQLKAPVQVTLMQDIMKRRYALNRYIFDLNMDLNKLFEQFAVWNDEVFDLSLLIKFHDYEEIIQCRVGKPRFKARVNMKASSAISGQNILSINPYYTFKKFNLSFQVDCFEKDAYKYMRRLMYWAWFIRPFYKKKDIWIVGERSYKAQDTGYNFFKYMRQEHPEKNTYYVIENDSPEKRNVTPYGNVLIYKSKEHIKHVLMSTRVIGSHHPDYLYQLRIKEFTKKIKAKRIFLQHGVMGTKNMVANYGKSAPGFDTDLFLVSSTFEKNMIVHDFGYKQDEVKVTGLSRYDNLFVDDVPKKRQLLIIPTWRDWLMHDDRFLESEYFERYLEL